MMKLELIAWAHALHAQIVMMDYRTKMKRASTVVANVLFALHVTMESRIKMKPASISEVPVQPAQLVTMKSKIKMKQASTVEDHALLALATFNLSFAVCFE